MEQEYFQLKNGGNNSEKHLIKSNMAVYTVLSYNIFGKVFDFNQNLNARFGVLRAIAIKVCCKSSYKQAVWLLSDSKKPVRFCCRNRTQFTVPVG